MKNELRRLPDDFLLTPARREYAASRTTNPDEEFEAFKDYHLSRGTKFLDWDAAWRTWCRNAQNFQKPSRPRYEGPKIGFTVPAGRMERDEVEAELASLTPEQKQANIRKLGDIIRGIKSKGEW